MEEVQQRRIDRLKLKYSKIVDINILKKRYSEFKCGNKLELFIKILGKEKFDQIVYEINKPFKHKKETIEFLRQVKLNNFIEEKNNLIEFLIKNPTLTRNNYYHNLNSKQLSSKLGKFLRGKFSHFLTEEEKKLIRNRPKTKQIMTKEKLLEKKMKLSRPIIIEGDNYISASEASKILNIDRGTIRFRIKSEKYPNYKYL